MACGYPMAVVDITTVKSASENMLLVIAKGNGFDITDYQKQSTNKV